MKRGTSTRMGVFGLALLAWTVFAPLVARADEVKLTVREPDEAARASARVTTGVPFARGALKDAGTLAVSLDGKPVPAQFRAHVPWDDGSVRWALMNVQVPVEKGGTAELVLSQAGGNPAPPQRAQARGNPAPPQRAQATAEGNRARVTTGPLEFAVSTEAPGLFEHVKVDGKTLVSGAGRGPFIVLEDGKTVVVAKATEVSVEESGPVRAVVRVRGDFPGIHDGLLRYAARIEAWAGQKAIQIDFWLENHGAIGFGEAKDEWASFQGMGLEFGLDLGGAVQASCEGVEGAGAFKVLQQCLAAKDRDVGGRDNPRYTWDDFAFTVSSGDAELKIGDRTDGIVLLHGKQGRLTAAIREFWQNYEKAIELKDNTLRYWLWPVEGQWPKGAPWTEPPNYIGETLGRMSPGENLYRYPGGLHKGHTFVLDFSGTSETEVGAELNTPLFALAPSEYIAATDATPGLFAPGGVRVEKNREANFKLASWERMQRSASDPANPTSIFSARRTSWRANIGYRGENGHWFGWMDFGDISVPGRGQIGVDRWSHVILLNALRFGDPQAMKLGAQMARHTRDIDQIWSDRDMPNVRGLQKRGVLPFFHVNNLDRVHSNWRPRPGNRTAGLALHYMLTGDPKSREACLRNGAGLIDAWKTLSKSEAYGNPQLNLGRNLNTISVYVTLYELTTDQAWLDAAMGLFNTHIRTLHKAHGPHLHAANQTRGQGYARQDQAYCEGVQWLCDLHHVSGDEEVLNLLKEACDREFPTQNFFEAPMYISGLFAYVGAKTDNADYLRQASSMFAQSFPESRSPPVFIPNNSAWHGSESQLRSGLLLQYGWWMQGRKKGL